MLICLGKTWVRYEDISRISTWEDGDLKVEVNGEIYWVRVEHKEQFMKDLCKVGGIPTVED